MMKRRRFLGALVALPFASQAKDYGGLDFASPSLGFVTVALSQEDAIVFEQLTWAKDEIARVFVVPKKYLL